MRSSSIPLLIAALCVGLFVSPASSAQSGDLSFGASYSTLHGPTGEVVFSAEELGAEKHISTSVSYRGGPEGEAGRWSFLWAPETESGTLTYSASAHVQNWDHIHYESQGARLSVLRKMPVSSRVEVGVGAFVEYDDITSVTSTSSLLTRAVGEGVSAGITALSRYEIGDFGPGLPEDQRLRLSASMRLAGLGDRKFGSLELVARFDAPLPEGFALATKLRGGFVRGLDDDYVSVLHRAFQGEAEPRGFEYGGLGPRDTLTGDPLGGTNYYAGSVEVRRSLGDAPVVVGGFIDFGSTWSLPGASDLWLEDGHAVRATAGISLEISSELGSLRLAYAEPLTHEPHDRLQRVSVALVARF
tara:strand:+ start:2427 stop:3500 length:1074 start_codon:yes stop_codon:yes gene_type:complete